MAENARQKIDREVKENLARLGERVVVDALAYYEGDTDILFNRATYIGTTTTHTIEGITQTSLVGLGDAYSIVSIEKFSDYWLNYKSEGITLSERIRDSASEASKIVQRTLDEHIRQRTNWKKLTKQFTADKVSSGDLPKYLKELEAQAKKILLGPSPSVEETRKLQKLLANASRNVEKLHSSGKSVSRIKQAYSGVLKAVEDGDIKSLAEKMEYAVQRKAIYNNERISRTETARAYGQSVVRKAVDSGAEYIKFTLSSAHVVPDECDVHTGANAFNVGRGVYPIDSAPPYPFHPNCKCLADPLRKSVSDKREVKYSKKRVNDEISRLPKYKQKSILGVDGKLRVDDVKGYEMPKKMKALPSSLIKRVT